MSGRDLELRIMNGGSRWRLQPQAAVEIWRGMVLIATVDGACLCRLMAHYLQTAELVVALARPTPPAAPALRPLAALPPTTVALRATRRQQRRARKAR